MRIKHFFSVFCIFASSVLSAETTLRGVKQFDAWEVAIRVDDFEGEVQPRLEAAIHSQHGSKLGSFVILGFVALNGRFHSAIVGIEIHGLDATWPECDYEYTKYKIDSSDSAYFPTRSHACPVLDFNHDMVYKFKRGKEFRFSASGKTGVVDLTGFTKAWEYTISNLSN